MADVRAREKIAREIEKTSESNSQETSCSKDR